MNKLPLYFDYMSTTPLDPRVRDAMVPFLQSESGFGNPSSTTHELGRQAIYSVEQARMSVANLIGAKSDEITWTSGATESNNLALFGSARFYGRHKKHIVSLTTEHKSVLNPLRQLEREGFEVTFIQPPSSGVIDLDLLLSHCRDDTLLVSCCHANSEIGVIQPIETFSKALRSRGILFHVDAAQSVGKLPIDVQDMGIDLLSMSSHKLYGPKGIGALFVSHNPRVRLQPLLFGGDQEKGLRSGTVPTHQVVGFGVACELVVSEMESESKRLLTFREDIWSSLCALGNIQLHGCERHRLPGNLNFSVGGVEGESLLLALNELALSSTSACVSGSTRSSHVLEALGVPEDQLRSVVRLSMGRFTTQAHVECAIAVLTKQIKQLREFAPPG